jgi:hypothetical protein
MVGLQGLRHASCLCPAAMAKIIACIITLGGPAVARRIDRGNGDFNRADA